MSQYPFHSCLQLSILVSFNRWSQLRVSSFSHSLNRCNVSRFRSEVSQYPTLSVSFNSQRGLHSQDAMSIRGTILVQVSSSQELEVSQYLTLSVKYPISLNRWSQLSVFTLKIQCPFEVQYWSKCPQGSS